jgi:hypothetical protein
VNRWTLQQNISRFKDRLKGSLDAVERHTIERLLAEEQRKLKELERMGSGVRDFIPSRLRE